jgi:hypothetical protein
MGGPKSNRVLSLVTNHYTVRVEHKKIMCDQGGLVG